MLKAVLLHTVSCLHSPTVYFWSTLRVLGQPLLILLYA